jgi:hypothetical protein
MSLQGDAVKKTPRVVSRETTVRAVSSMFHVSHRGRLTRFT